MASVEGDHLEAGVVHRVSEKVMEAMGTGRWRKEIVTARKARNDGLTRREALRLGGRRMQGEIGSTEEVGIEKMGGRGKRRQTGVGMGAAARGGRGITVIGGNVSTVTSERGSIGIDGIGSEGTGGKRGGEVGVGAEVRNGVERGRGSMSGAE